MVETFLGGSRRILNKKMRMICAEALFSIMSRRKKDQQKSFVKEGK